MKNHRIITISREYGSGGSDIAKLLSKRLNIALYDKNLLTRIAKESGFAESILKMNDEKANHSFLYSLFLDTQSMKYFGAGYSEMPMNQKLFLAQYDTIKKIAEEESCVFVGRCADYVLKNHPNKMSLFIHASNEDDKIKRISERKEISSKEALELAKRKDKDRSSYYNYYTEKKWGQANEYDLCLDTSKLSIDNCVNLILEYIHLKDKKGE